MPENLSLWHRSTSLLVHSDRCTRVSKIEKHAQYPLFRLWVHHFETMDGTDNSTIVTSLRVTGLQQGGPKHQVSGRALTESLSLGVGQVGSRGAFGIGHFSSSIWRVPGVPVTLTCRETGFPKGTEKSDSRTASRSGVPAPARGLRGRKGTVERWEEDGRPEFKS